VGTFQELCKSVYDEKAFEQLQHVAGIRAGNVHEQHLSLSVLRLIPELEARKKDEK
jgi:hypothetical protein